MANGVKETACTHCVHREVCKYKKELLNVIEEANRIDVSQSDCIAGVDVICKFYQENQARSRKSVF